MYLKNVFCLPGAEYLQDFQGKQHFRTVLSGNLTCFSSTSQPQDSFFRPLAGSLVLESSVQCQYCPEILCSATLYQRHLSSCHASVMPYCCKICGKGVQTKGGMHLHMVTHGERKFVCSVCDSKFKFKHHLKSHLSSVHKLMQCAVCAMTFRELNDYRSHVLMCITNK